MRLPGQSLTPGRSAPLAGPSLLGHAVVIRSFFYLVPSRLEDLHLHGLPAQGALQLPNPLLGHAQFARRHDLVIRADGCLTPRSISCFHLRTRLCETESSRLSSAMVSSPRSTRPTWSRLNSGVNRRRPSDPRRCVSIAPHSFEKPTYALQSASSNRGTQHPHLDQSARDGNCYYRICTAARAADVRLLAFAVGQASFPCPTQLSVLHS